MKNKNTVLLKQFDVAIQSVGKETPLGIYLKKYQIKLLNNQLKGIEIPRFIDNISKIARVDNQGIPTEVLKLMSMVNKKGILGSFGLGLRML